MGSASDQTGSEAFAARRASATIAFGLVFDQDPDLIRTRFRDFVRAHVPPAFTVEFTGRGSCRPAFFPPDLPAIRLTREALTCEWGRPAATRASQIQIAAARELQSRLGMNVVLTGFAREDDGVHRPNEKYDLSSFHRGIRSWVRILSALRAL
jgi:acetylornithine deacetylase/succinyl-diaminopimelate desuccinylase-like protein